MTSAQEQLGANPPIRTCEMHTAGMPVRIIETGLPEIPGDTILEKQNYFRKNLNQFRKMLMWEPRGHSDMYGAALVPPCHPEAHMGVLFMDNGGLSTMCGHATMAVARYAVDKGLVKSSEIDSNNNTNEIVVNVECPCGLVKAFVTNEPGKPEHGAVRFLSVAAFLYKPDLTLTVDGIGDLVVDVSYGGNFYVLVEASKLGIEVGVTPLTDMIKTANLVSAAAKQCIQFVHPDPAQAAALQYLYGVILTDTTQLAAERETNNVCVFAESQVDRSPCGSGVTSRMAALYAKREVDIGTTVKFISGITKGIFEAKVIAETKSGDVPAVIVEVKGQSFHCGAAEFTFDKFDPLSAGFLSR